MAKAQLTILVPVYNEEESLWKFQAEMDKFLGHTSMSSNVLFIDDGSTDRSLQIIKTKCQADSRYFFISLAKNGGLSTALKAGIDWVTTPYTGYIDSDLQTTPSDFNLYFKHLKSHALVNGIRAKRNDKLIKRISSKVANGFRRFMINDGVHDTCCPLKIMHTSFAKNFPFFSGMHRFIPAFIQLQGGSIKEVEIQHFERYAGTAKYNLLNRMVGPFIDTLVFVWMRKRNIRYTISESSKRSHSEAAKQKVSYE